MNKTRILYVKNVWRNIFGILKSINAKNVIKHAFNVMVLPNIIVLSVKNKELKLLIANVKGVYVGVRHIMILS